MERIQGEAKNLIVPALTKSDPMLNVSVVSQ